MEAALEKAEAEVYASIALAAKAREDEALAAARAEGQAEARDRIKTALAAMVTAGLLDQTSYRRVLEVVAGVAPSVAEIRRERER